MSHPIPCAGGSKCTAKPVNQDRSRCGRCDMFDTCCPDDAIDCEDSESGYLCLGNPEYGNSNLASSSHFKMGLKIENLITGYLCPTSHPYACAMGSKCSSAVWKPISGETDCDGGKLVDKSSTCCPTDGVISCNGDQRYKCWSNPSFQGR